MTDVNNAPTNNGVNGAAPGEAGAAGTVGANSVAYNIPFTQPPEENINSAEAAGASGGNGGNGVAGATPTATPGAAGAGANGGTAKAVVVTTSQSSETRTYTPPDPTQFPVIADASATGGNGGNAGTPGTAAGAGANGGSGGTATASANAANTGSDDVYAHAIATGGSGGFGYGVGHTGGNGGVATIVTSPTITTLPVKGSSAATATSDTQFAIVKAEQIGGSAGAGLDDANGGVAAASTLTNAVSGATNQGTLDLIQLATGGNGGDSSGGTASAGGAATSTLTFNDVTTNPNSPSAFIGATVTAQGGNGGNGTHNSALLKASAGAAGGNATASGAITGALDHVSSFGGQAGVQVTAIAGAGGNVNTNANGGAGGIANATLLGTTTSGAGGIAGATAYGGNGGSVGVPQWTIRVAGTPGSGGAGGAATAKSTGSTTATGALPAVDHSNVDALWKAASKGGVGGDGDGAGKTGGVGGTATATASGTSKSTSIVAVSAIAVGGAGGYGYESAAGGAGGAVTLTNSVTGQTAGGNLYLYQTAVGGNGGGSAGGKAAAGGAAASNLTFSEKTSVAIVGGATATGGNGGVGNAYTFPAVGTKPATKVYSPGAAGGAATITETATGALAQGSLSQQTYFTPGAPTLQPGFGGIATGGNGGDAVLKATGGAGGAANATVTGTIGGTNGTGDGGSIGVIAQGGTGGNALSNGNGGAGGAAKGSTTGSTALVGTAIGAFDAAFGASVQGGNGGWGDGTTDGTANGPRSVGGAGAGVTVTSGTIVKATSTTYSAIRVAGAARGGAGGDGYDNANGGVGGSVTLTNAVSGATKQGFIGYGQVATGGAGGNAVSGGAFGQTATSSTGAGGNGGAANSSLTVADTTSAFVFSQVIATGGKGGSGATYGAGGNATATSNISGKGTFYVAGHDAQQQPTQLLDTNGNPVAATFSQAIAIGGNGGSDFTTGIPTGVAGTASANATATGPLVEAIATAIAGQGSTSAGSATAKATGTGTTGTFAATATSDPTAASGVGVYGFKASAAGSVDGAGSSGIAFTTANALAPTSTFDTTYQAEAQVTGVNSTIPASAPNTAAAFTANGTITPDIYASGELGGAYDKGGTSSENVATSVSFTIDPSRLSTQGDLLIGLLNGTSIGTGFHGLTFDVSATQDGTSMDLLANNPPPSFASGTNPSYFSDDPLDLGSVDVFNDQRAYTLTISLTESFTTANHGGFYTKFIVGDPPPSTGGTQTASAEPAASHGVNGLAAALFDSFFGQSGTDASLRGSTPAGLSFSSLAADVFGSAAPKHVAHT